MVNEGKVYADRNVVLFDRDSWNPPSITLTFRMGLYLSLTGCRQENHDCVRSACRSASFRSRNAWACRDVTGLQIIIDSSSQPASCRTVERFHLPSEIRNTIKTLICK